VPKLSTYCKGGRNSLQHQGKPLAIGLAAPNFRRPQGFWQASPPTIRTYDHLCKMLRAWAREIVTPGMGMAYRPRLRFPNSPRQPEAEGCQGFPNHQKIFAPPGRGRAQGRLENPAGQGISVLSWSQACSPKLFLPGWGNSGTVLPPLGDCCLFCSRRTMACKGCLSLPVGPSGRNPGPFAALDKADLPFAH
jgi:hypothetical protein